MKSNRQLPDGILPPWRASVKDIHNGALKEHLGIVYSAVDVLRGMVAQNSVQDGVNNCAHSIDDGAGNKLTSADFWIAERAKSNSRLCR